MADKDKQPQQADFDKAWENIKKGKTMPSENDMGPLPKYKPKSVSSKTPEPTFKSDVDAIVSGVKKADTKLTETLDKGLTKAAGKTEKGILNTRLSKDYKKGGSVSSASKRADGCVTKGKTKGRII